MANPLEEQNKEKSHSEQDITKQIEELQWKINSCDRDIEWISGYLLTIEESYQKLAIESCIELRVASENIYKGPFTSYVIISRINSNISLLTDLPH